MLSQEEKLRRIQTANPHFINIRFLLGGYVSATCRGCNQEKIYGAQYARKQTTCIICKCKNKHSYNKLTKLYYCKTCDKHYEYPDSNHHSRECHICSDRDNAEVRAIRLLQAAGYDIKKSFKYVEQYAITADIRVTKNDSNLILSIEVDGESHRSDKRRHIFKDRLFKRYFHNRDSRRLLLHINNDDVDNYIVNVVNRIFNMYSENNPRLNETNIFVCFTRDTKSFYKDIYKKSNINRIKMKLV